MAKPTYYPDWATQTVTLPGTKNTNKIRPKETIRNVGMDFGQIMTCEEMNWILNNIGLWMRYIVDDFMPTLPTTYLPLVGTKIILSGDAIGEVTWNGDPAVNLNVQVVDNSHNHVSANITDATSEHATPNVLVRRTGGGSIIGGDIISCCTAPTDAATYFFRDFAGTTIGNISSEPNAGGSLTIQRIDPSRNVTSSGVYLSDGGYVLISNPRSNDIQEYNGNSLVRLDHLNSQIGNVQNNLNIVNNSLSTNINNVNNSVQNLTNYSNNTFVRDIRLGSEISANRYDYGQESFVYRAPGGYMITGFNIWSSSSNNDEFRNIYSRPVQKNINGNWYTVGQA